MLYKNGNINSHPVMMGPLLVHQKKAFSSYHFFISSLVGLRPALKNVQSFGTDGEQALINALSIQFPSAIHVRCFLHFKDNIKFKLTSGIKLPMTATDEFLADIFGKPSADW